jgi:hypothetical protein
MPAKRRPYIIAGATIVLILAVAFWWKQHEAQAQIQARLHLATTHVSDTANVFRQALAPNFAVSQDHTIKAGCVEKSPEISFTRLYDCNATAKIELSRAQAISTSQAEASIRGALSSLGVASADLEDIDRYAQDMTDIGSWEMAQPVNIPHTAIAGVPPFNYYGGTGQENIGIKLASKMDSASPKKISLSVTTVQEYHTCKSFFLPCVDVLRH